MAWLIYVVYGQNYVDLLSYLKHQNHGLGKKEKKEEEKTIEQTMFNLEMMKHIYFELVLMIICL